MRPPEIRQLLEEAPFDALTIHMANGRKAVVDHPEIVAFPADKRALAVALRTGGFAHIELKLATHTEPETKPSRGPEALSSCSIPQRRTPMTAEPVQAHLHGMPFLRDHQTLIVNSEGGRVVYNGIPQGAFERASLRKVPTIEAVGMEKKA